MKTEEITSRTIEFVKHTLAEAEAGHNFYHIERVWKNALKIAKNYHTNDVLLNLGALLHDIADAKFYDGDESIGPKMAEDFLRNLSVEGSIIDQVKSIIKHISFKNKAGIQPDFIEFKIIQDADRLDAIGAIGIARAFHYGGYKNRQFYDPLEKPVLNLTDEDYKKRKSTTINHFYEKLLLIKDMMNTKEGTVLAEKRHAFMQEYLEQFYGEWNAN